VIASLSSMSLRDSTPRRVPLRTRHETFDPTGGTHDRKALDELKLALFNILADLTAERSSFAAGQRALLNILQDSEVEKANLRGAQRAVLNILQDFDAEKSKIEVFNGLLQQEIAERKRQKTKSVDSTKIWSNAWRSERRPWRRATKSWKPLVIPSLTIFVLLFVIWTAS